MTSQHAITAAQSVETDVAWIFLIEISTPGNPVLRLCANSEPIMSRGNEYHPFPFDVKLGMDDGETLPSVQISFLHLDGAITEAIRSFKEAPGIRIELITSISPDIVERELSGCKLRNVTYDAMSVSGSLEVLNTLTAMFPAESYTPNHYPGLFV